MESSKQVGITEVVVRDGIQSLLATRVPLRDLVSILPALDKVGYWSLETWVVPLTTHVLDILMKTLGKDLELSIHF